MAITEPQTSTKKRTSPRAPQRAGTSNPPAADGGEHGPQDSLGRYIARRVANATSVSTPNQTFMRLFQSPVWDLLCDHYFRLEVDGWKRIPDETSLVIGVHSGGALTMDAWTLVHSGYRRFGQDRTLHGTGHDVLMALPGLGDYFKACGAIPASREGVSAALAAGHDVVMWPG